MPEQNKDEYGLRLAYRLACERIAGMNDAEIECQCQNSGSTYQMEGTQKIIHIKYLNRLYKLTLPNIDISLSDSDEEVKIKEQLLIMHYFSSAKGTPLASKPISFKELSGGNVYLRTFIKRTIEPLVSKFEKNPDHLIEAAQKLGGRQAEYGDASVIINAFEHTPITIVLWRGDDEFPAEGNIIFDRTIADYLSTEDTTILCETITWKLIRG